jgi:hypothetical protein
MSGLYDEAKEQFDAVAVAAHRRRSKSLHRDQGVQEERLQDGAERL